ncbi:MAG: TonB-dependent receptor domain-containing protein, partial [Bryobacteraceae bacterium]
WTSVTDQRFQYAINRQRQTAYDLASPTLANPNLKWETTVTRDIGTDFSFFKSKLSGTIDVYWNTTKDLLMLTFEMIRPAGEQVWLELDNVRFY